jgi:integrase
VNFKDLASVWDNLEGLSNADLAKVYIERTRIALNKARAHGLFLVVNGKVSRKWLSDQVGCKLSALRQNRTIREEIDAFDCELCSSGALLNSGIKLPGRVPSVKIAEISDSLELNPRLRQREKRLREYGRIVKVRVCSGELDAIIPTILWNEGIDIEASDWLRSRAIDSSPTEKSLYEEAKILRSFIRFRRAAGVRWQDIDDALIREYRNGESKKRIKTSTVNRKIGVIYAFYSWAENTARLDLKVQTGPRNELPMEYRNHRFAITAKLRRSHSNTYGESRSYVSSLHIRTRESKIADRHTPTDEQVRRIHRVGAKRRHGVRDLLMYSWIEETGGRRMDFLQLTVTQLPTSEQLELIRDGALPWVVKIIRKGQVEGVLRPSADLLERCIDYVENERQKMVARAEKRGHPDCGMLFVSQKGGPLKEDSVTKAATEAFRLANVPKASLHRLRAVFATKALRAFIQAFSSEIKGIAPNSNFGDTILVQVAEMMGHRSVESLRHYLEKELNRIALNSESFANYDLDREILQKQRLVETLEKRIEMDRNFFPIIERVQQGDKTAAVQLLHTMIDEIENLAIAA